MSVIVGIVRDGIAALAADSLCPRDNLAESGCKFQALSDRFAFGVAGDEAMRQWFAEYYGPKADDAAGWNEAEWGREQRGFLRWCRDECNVNLTADEEDSLPSLGSTFMAATPRGIFTLYGDGFAEAAEFAAIGIGEDAAAGARAALEAACWPGAEKAETLAIACVEAACAVIRNCGGPVVSLAVPLAHAASPAASPVPRMAYDAKGNFLRVEPADCWSLKHGR